MTLEQIAGSFKFVYHYSGIPPKTGPQMRRFNPSTGRTFKPGAMKEAEASYFALLADQAPPNPIKGPLEVIVLAAWPFRASDTSTKAKEAKAATHSIRHTVKPDPDNLAKMILDALVQLQFIHSDAEISELRIVKRFAAKAGITIGINQLEEYV